MLLEHGGGCVPRSTAYPTTACKPALNFVVSRTLQPCLPGNLFFKDYTSVATDVRIKNWDRQFAQLKALPNVVITPHVAFMTDVALHEIEQVTEGNLRAMALGEELVNEVTLRK